MPKPEPVRQQQQRAAEALDQSGQTDNAERDRAGQRGPTLAAVDWRALAVALGALLIAFARRDVPGVITAVAQIAAALGVAWSVLDAARVASAAEMLAARPDPTRTPRPKTLEERIDAAANVE